MPAIHGSDCLYDPPTMESAGMARSYGRGFAGMARSYDGVGNHIALQNG